jgi:hypothetical protein
MRVEGKEGLDEPDDVRSRRKRPWERAPATRNKREEELGWGLEEEGQRTTSTAGKERPGRWAERR